MVEILRQGIVSDKTGIYNVAGDGVMTINDIARRLDKRVLNLPVSLVRESLRLLRMARLTQYGPEQVDFLRYRPVLANRRLKEEFGYVPAKTSREAFEVFAEGRSG